MSRLMERYEDGKCYLLPGVNIMDAFERLCALEDVLEAVGIEDAEQLRKLLANVKAATSPTTFRAWCEICYAENLRKIPERTWTVRHFCRECENFIPDKPGAKRGICTVHVKQVKKTGRRDGPLVTVPGEHRSVVASRPACAKEFRPIKTKAERPPAERATEWVGPSAELLPDDTAGRCGQRPLQRGDKKGAG